MTQTPDDRFDRDSTSPIQWRNRANDLRAAAAAIDFAIQSEAGSEIVAAYRLGAGFSMAAATSPVRWMCYGMALEALLKSALLRRGARPPRTHDLVKLARLVDITLSPQQTGILEILTEAVVWFARYPVPTEKSRDSIERLELASRKHLSEPVAGSPLLRRYNGALRWQSLEEIWSVCSAATDDIEGGL